MNFQDFILSLLGSSTGNVVQLKVLYWEQNDITTTPVTGHSGLPSTGQGEETLSTETSFITNINQFLQFPLTGEPYTDWFSTPVATPPTPFPTQTHLIGVDGFNTTMGVEVELQEVVKIDCTDKGYVELYHPDESKNIYQIYEPRLYFNGETFTIKGSSSCKVTTITTGDNLLPIVIDGVLYERTEANRTAIRTALEECTCKALSFFLPNYDPNADSPPDTVEGNYSSVGTIDEFGVFVLEPDDENILFQITNPSFTIEEGRQYRITNLTAPYADWTNLHFIGTDDGTGNIIFGLPRDGYYDDADDEDPITYTTYEQYINPPAPGETGLLTPGPFNVDVFDNI